MNDTSNGATQWNESSAHTKKYRPKNITLIEICYSSAKVQF